MGTRADFYIGRGENAEWLGSIAYDGHPCNFEYLQGKTEKQFRNYIKKTLSKRDDFTFVKDGWPWPWDDSCTTDYAYALENGIVWCSSFGHEWFELKNKEEPERRDNCEKVIFPNMKNKQNITLGKRSGIMLIG